MSSVSILLIQQYIILWLTTKTQKKRKNLKTLSSESFLVKSRNLDLEIWGNWRSSWAWLRSKKCHKTHQFSFQDAVEFFLVHFSLYIICSLVALLNFVTGKTLKFISKLSLFLPNWSEVMWEAHKIIQRENVPLLHLIPE